MPLVLVAINLTTKIVSKSPFKKKRRKLRSQCSLVPKRKLWKVELLLKKS